MTSVLVPIGQANAAAAAENPEPDAAPADTGHPVGEEQAQRNIEQEPPG